MTTSYVQLRGDVGSRVTLSHVKAAEETWRVDGAYTHFEGRRHPVGARSEFVTRDWAISTLWGPAERADAESLVSLLKTAALGTDARLDVHIHAAPGGTDVDFVGEVHSVPQSVVPGRSEIELTVREVDT